MRSLLAVIAFVLIAAGPAPDPLADIERKVLRVQLQNSVGDQAECSAWVAAEGIAITAGHCTPDADLTVAGRAADVERSNARLDVAVLSFSSRREMAFELAKEKPSYGQPVIVVGYIWGELHVQYGHVANPLSGSGQLMISAPILNGDSGGAVLDLEGRLLGMTIGRRPSGNGYLGVAVPADALADLIPKR